MSEVLPRFRVDGPIRRDTERHPLDDLVWSALGGTHARFDRGDGAVRRYDPQVAPFCAVADPALDNLARLSALVEPGEQISILTPEAIPGLDILTPFHIGRIDQMVMRDAAPSEPPQGLRPIRLGAADVPDMLTLTAETKPGPFRARTIELGRYVGVRIDGRLAAMAGERMRIPGFTEISAVCVSTDHRGKGLASLVLDDLIATIRARGDTPFLHVFDDNSAAALYRRRGFVLRREMHLARYIRSPDASQAGRFASQTTARAPA